MATKPKAKIPGSGLTEADKRKIKRIMAFVSIRKAAHKAGLPPDLYHNVMAGRSKNFADFNKIIAEAKIMAANKETLVL